MRVGGVGWCPVFVVFFHLLLLCTKKCITNTSIFVALTKPHLTTRSRTRGMSNAGFLRLPPLLARSATVLFLLATTCPKLPLLRDALERIDDALDNAMMKRRKRQKHEEEEEENSDDDDSDDQEESSLRVIKKSADSIAALRAMEHRRGRRALVKDAFAKKLAGERNTSSICDMYIT